MKYFQYLFAFFLLADPFSPRAVAGQPFSLTMSTKDPTLKLGSEIVIDLALKNVSSVERNVAKSNAPRQAELYYQVLVTDSKSHAAKETRYARQITGELLQGGYGYAKYDDGKKEDFGFLGVGAHLPFGQIGLSEYASHVRGEPSTTYQRGINIDFGGPGSGSGFGIGANYQSITACVDQHSN